MMNPFDTTPYGTLNSINLGKQGEPVKLNMTQGLTASELNSLSKISILDIPEEEKVKAYCAHRDCDNIALLANSEGQYKCKICDTVIDHNIDLDELKKSVDVVVNALEKCKLQLLRLPMEDIRNYFEIIPKVKRLPELYEISCKEFAKEFEYTLPATSSIVAVEQDNDSPAEEIIIEDSAEEIINNDSEIMDKIKETVLIDEKKLEEAVSVIITVFRRNKGRILNRTKWLTLKKSIKKELLILARYANRKNIICSFNNDGQIISISHMKFLRDTYNIPFVLEPSKSSNKYTIKEVPITKK